MSSKGDSTAVDPSYGVWDDIHKKLEKQDADRKAWLDRYVGRMNCKVCGIKLTDYWQKIHPNRCAKHRKAP